MKFTTIASASALLALAGCGGFSSIPVVSSTDQQRYTPYSNAAFVGNGQLDLIGTTRNPGDRETLAQVAAKGISDGAIGGKFLLTPSEDAQIPARNRVVVAIGGANSWDLCSNPPERGGEFIGPYLTVSAASCSGTTRIASTNATVQGLNGVDDPAIARMFQQIGAALFPGSNIDYQPQDRGIRRS